MFRKFWKRRGLAASSNVKGSLINLKETFELEKHGTHGFPLGPSALAYDPCRHVMYIGTSVGELNLYGKPGVKLASVHLDNYKVLQILPFSTEPALITVCSNNILNKWLLLEEDDKCQLVLKRTYKFQGGLAKTITTCCLPPYGDCLFVGTLGGITYPMDTEFDGMSPEVLSWSRARTYLGYKGKDVPGEVRILKINPAYPKQLLIGYEHSYFELWDAMTWKPITIFGPHKGSGDLKDVYWHCEGDRFISAHVQGHILIWNSQSPSSPPTVKTIYESSNLHPIGTVIWPEDEFIIFSGGAPYDMVDGDSVTIYDNKETMTLQLTSPVKGIQVIDSCITDRDSGIVGITDTGVTSTARKILILLLEQEILFIDLSLPELPLLQPPYLYSLHNSPVKEVAVYGNLNKEVWSLISCSGKIQQDAIYRAPSKVWPVDGGLLETLPHDSKDVLLSGHEDGSVKFWDIRLLSMKLLYEVNCIQYFNTPSESEFIRPDSPIDNQGQCRQVGFWDPRSDDDQLIVTSLKLIDDHLLVGFQGGHTLLLTISNQTADRTIILLRVSIMREDPRQRPRGWQAPLEVRTDPMECPPGFQPSHCIHFFPTVPVTALGLSKEQNLIAVGCVYGFAVVDYQKNETIYVHCTFNQEVEDLNSMSRMQSIRRSFRQSMQRVNMRRSMRGMQSINRSIRRPQASPLARSGSARPALFNRVSSVRRTTGGQQSTSGGKENIPPPSAAAPPPLKRDSIRTITFTAPTHVGGSSLVHGLLVGTNQGAVLGFTIDVPVARLRHSRSPVVMPVDKEFSPRKNSSVLFVGVIDGLNYLLDVNDEESYKQKGTHYMIICTEEMLKVISIPNSKKKYRVKFKQNEQDELHAVSAHYLRISGQSVILVMDSEGNISIYSLPDLSLIHKEDCVDAADAVGQRHFVCSNLGIVLHQKSPSEFVRASLTDATRLDVKFTLPAKAITPQTPARFSRPLSDGPHLIELQEGGGVNAPIEEESEIFDELGPISSKTEILDELGPVNSKTSVESNQSSRSRKSTSGESRKSVELPDHYFVSHNPELKERFQERAL